MDLVSLLNEIKLIAIEQGELLEKAFKSPESVEFIIKDNQDDKGWTDRDILTEIDGRIEKEFYDRLSSKFPELGFGLEEHMELNDTSKEYVCYIDPVDGTKYFANDVPLFASSIGVIRNGEPVLGVVYNPLTEQMYSGAENIPTTLNSKEVHVSSCDSLDRAMLSLDVATRKENWESEKDWMTEKIATFNLHAGRIRLLGIGALSSAWVASGALDAFVSIWGHGSKPFDIAAGKALIKYAGGKILDLEVPGLSSKRFIGGNEYLVDKIASILLE